MVPASLIGFGLVLLVVSGATSLLLAGGLLVARMRLRHLGPWAERRAATLAVVLPPLFGLAVAVIIGATKLLAAGADHCLAHPQYPHLCPAHGEHWATVPWAVAAVASVGTFVLVRMAQAIWAHLGAQRATAELRRAGAPIDGDAPAFVVPSQDSIAFTAGVVTPTIIVSTATWDALDAEQRRALIAHERAHVAHGDLWKRAALGVLACLGVPGLTGRALGLWQAAAERICDRSAAAEVGRPSIVAGAIVSLSQMGNQRAPATAVFAAANDVNDRVEALFHQTSGGETTARRLALVSTLVSILFGVVCVHFADALHHMFERALG